MNEQLFLNIKCLSDATYEFAEELLPVLSRDLSGMCKVFFLYELPKKPETGGTPPTEIMVAFLGGSALSAAFTAFYQIICKYLERHASREVVLERGDAKITVKGHSIPDERSLIKEFFPEASIQIAKR